MAFIMRLIQWFEEFCQDLRTGARQLLKSPGFTFVAVLLLALGIGANAAIFGVLKSVLIDALPYRDADHLVRIWGGVKTTPQIPPLNASGIEAIAARQRSFSSLAAFDMGPSDSALSTDRGPQPTVSAHVEPQLFDTLGVVPALGRTFRPDEAVNGLAPLSAGQLAPDTAPVVVLADRAWRQFFDADPGVIGRVVRIDGVPRTVIGVLPRGFVAPMSEADFYFAMDLAPVAAHPIAGRRSGWLGLVGRLRPGVTAEQARMDVAGLWAGFARRYPNDNIVLSAETVPLREAMVGDTQRPLLLLIASAGLVLLIACANLAAALLSRALARRKEFAVRLALGAGHSRIIRQLLTESLLLAGMGGTAGLLLAAGALRLGRTYATTALPAYAVPALDTGATTMMAVVSIATGLLFGLAPALAAVRRESSATLRDDSRGATEGHHSRVLRGLLLSGQIALSVSLLAGAGLLARSLYAMTVTPLGVRTDGVLTAGVRLPAAQYGTQLARSQFQQALLERVRAVPGVTAAALTTALPTTDIGQNGLTIDGVPPPPGGQQPFVLTSAVSDDYFATLQIPLRQGRLFDTRDRLDTPRVAIISESMARRYWPGGNALGARMRLGPNEAVPWTQVIGIVGDVRNDRARAEAAPIAYLPARLAGPPFLRLVLRTESDPLNVIEPVRQAVAALSPDLPLQRPAALDAVVGERLTSRRLPVILMVGFGLLALLLACVGVYAMFAAMTASREREFGVRMALGSRPSQIASLVLRQGAIWLALGLAAGIGGIAVISRMVGSLLYGVAPLDPLTIGGSMLVLMLCATLALVVPLRRATRVDPAIALRA